MPIDWFTVGAQALNFAILVWLMRRFLYQPVLDAITAREKRIADQLADAAAKLAEGRREQLEFEQRNLRFDAERAELLRKATDEANAERQRLLEAARGAADAARAEWARTLKADAGNLNAAIEQRTRQEVFAITRKVLAELASASLEERASALFLDRLRAAGGSSMPGLAQALKAASAADPALLRSAFDLPESQRAAIQAALDEIFAAPIALRFETAPELVGGIELGAGGQKLAWSISDYLASMAQGIDDVVNTKGMPATRVAPGRKGPATTAGTSP